MKTVASPGTRGGDAGAIGANASVALVEGAGHAAPYEAPERFVELVVRFLGSH